MGNNATRFEKLSGEKILKYFIRFVSANHFIQGDEYMDDGITFDFNNFEELAETFAKYIYVEKNIMVDEDNYNKFADAIHSIFNSHKWFMNREIKYISPDSIKRIMDCYVEFLGKSNENMQTINNIGIEDTIVGLVIEGTKDTVTTIEGITYTRRMRYDFVLLTLLHINNNPTLRNEMLVKAQADIDSRQIVEVMS